MRVQESHGAEIEGMKKELASITTELHHRNLAMASLSEKTGCLEKSQRDQSKDAERKVAELQVEC